MTPIRTRSIRIVMTVALAATTVLAGATAQQHPAAASHGVVTAAMSPDGPVPCCW